jgi:hypothetical protein
MCRLIVRSWHIFAHLLTGRRKITNRIVSYLQVATRGGKSPSIERTRAETDVPHYYLHLPSDHSFCTEASLSRGLDVAPSRDQGTRNRPTGT